MRRAQSVRHHTRPSLALAADDLGALKEADESIEDVLRRQLIDKDRENDKLQMQVQLLQAQLAQRPPLETIQELEKEYKNLELLLQGTQRENERCMAEMERGKTREKMLERELTKLAGENWQTTLDIAPQSAPSGPRSFLHHRSNTISSISSQRTTSPAPASEPPADVKRAHVEQVRLLILGMEQRLREREEKMSKCIQKAELESARCEDMRREILTQGS